MQNVSALIHTPKIEKRGVLKRRLAFLLETARFIWIKMKTKPTKTKLSKEELEAKRARKLKKKKSRLKEKTLELKNDISTLDLEKIKAKVAPGEKDYLDEYIWMFEKTSRLIRHTEKRALKSGQSRDIYALSTLISQQREIIADIRTLADLTGQILLLKEQVLQPVIQAIGQNTIDVYYQTRKLLMETVKPKETKFALDKLEELLKEQSKFLQVQYQQGTSHISRVMGNTVETDISKGKKKKSSSLRKV